MENFLAIFNIDLWQKLSRKWAQREHCMCLSLMNEACPGARASSLVGRSRDSGSGACPLLSGAGTWGGVSCFRVLGALNLRPVRWCLRPGSGFSGRHGNVQALLWAQPLCLWMGCVLTQLVAWLEMSQYWSLQAVGWTCGWVLRLISWKVDSTMLAASTRGHVVE